MALAGKHSNGDYTVHKTIRSGYTTSRLIYEDRAGNPTLIITPTKRIIGDTIKSTSNVVGIYGNAACKYIQKEIEKHPLLKYCRQTLPSCCGLDCKYANGDPDDDDGGTPCPILDIVKFPTAPRKALTMAKLEMIMATESEWSLFLRKCISNMKTVVVDESHTLVVGNAPQVPNTTTLTDLRLKLANLIPVGSKLAFPRIQKTLESWQRLLDYTEDLAGDLLRQVDADPYNWLIRKDRIPAADVLSPDDQDKVWAEMEKLAKFADKLKVEESEFSSLCGVLEILSQENIRLSYISQDGIGQVYVCGVTGHTHKNFKKYFKECSPNANVTFVSGTQYQPTPTFFQDLVGKEFGGVTLPFEEVVYPDVNDTNSKMTVYADTWRMSTNLRHTDENHIIDIIEFVKGISEARKNAPIIVYAPNIKIYGRLRQAFKKTCSNLYIDYYRSAGTIGVDINKDREVPFRIAIGIGLAEVPLHSFDCLTNSYAESQSARINSVDAATSQAVSRVKDPEGKEPSEVFFFGARAEDIQRMITWGPGRRVVKVCKNRYGVICDEELGKPTVMPVLRYYADSRDEKAEPYIKKVWDSANPLYIGRSAKNGKFPYINIREKPENITSPYIKENEPDRYFGALYSVRVNRDQLMTTIDTYDQYFRSYKFQHAEQSTKPNKTGKFEYRPRPTKDWTKLMKKMLSGDVTVATYPIRADSLTVQCAFDFDNHGGNTPARPRLQAAKYFIEEVLGIQAIPESTGSPDSYHLWIPIVPTQPAIVHDFLKAVLAELKNEYPDLAWHGTEVFPKTKNKHRALGVPLKLPLCINNKTGKRSELLGDNLESVDAIFITKLAELREPAEDSVKVGERLYIPARLSPPSSRPVVLPHRRFNSMKMRPCIVAALGRQLNGGEGHDMRIAVVCEALASGKSRDEIVKMFSGQADYDEATTAMHVDYTINRGYHPWKCSTLRNRCPGLVDCERCPIAPVFEYPLAEEESAAAQDSSVEVK